MHRRSLRLGLLTVLGLARKGYFIPYRHADKLPRPGAVPRYRAIAATMDQAAPQFAALLDRVDELADDLMAIGDAPPPAPRWGQDWWPLCLSYWPCVSSSLLPFWKDQVRSLYGNSNVEAG